MSPKRSSAKASQAETTTPAVAKTKKSERAKEEKLPQPWMTWWSRPVGRILDQVVYRTKISGKGNVPRSGPVIFAANHVSYLDGPVMVGASPRYMHVFVRDSVFKGFLSWVLHTSGQIPINREGDRKALDTARKILARGGCVGILPEGTRGAGDVASMASGVAWLAQQSKATVIPVAVLGARQPGEDKNIIPKPRRILHVAFGEPLVLSTKASGAGRAARDLAAEEIRLALSAHVRATVDRTGMALPGADTTHATEASPEGNRHVR